MSKDKKYLSSYVPEAKPKETPARGKVKSDTDLDKLRDDIREIQEQLAKNNRDQLYAMQNIGAKNLSSSFRRSLNGEFVKTNALIQTWADSQEVGFRAIADWQSEQEIILQSINGELETFVKTSELNAQIGAYIEGDGKASLISALSGTFAMQDELGNYVKATELNASIGQYISDDEGQAQIVSAVSGKFLTTDALNGYATTSYVASNVSQSVANGIAALTLSVTSGKVENGVLVDDGKSSTISLKNGAAVISSQIITLSGLVSFTDLSTAGSTFINGANIITGTLSADAVNVTDLKVKNVWFMEDNFPYTILTSSLSGTNSTIKLGITEDNGWAQALYLYGTVIGLYKSGGTGTPQIWADMAAKEVHFRTGWTFGTEDNNPDAYFDDVRMDQCYATDYNFEDGSWLTVTSSGKLRFYDADGNHTDLT